MESLYPKQRFFFNPTFYKKPIVSLVLFNSLWKFRFKFPDYQFFQLLFFISTFVTFIISELYFYIPNGVDHIYHSKYLSYFLYQSEDTYSGFGLIYYYIVALITHLRIQEVNNLNVVHFMNSSIITANFILFLFGILGIYFLLRK